MSDYDDIALMIKDTDFSKDPIAAYLKLQDRVLEKTKTGGISKQEGSNLIMQIYDKYYSTLYP